MPNNIKLSPIAPITYFLVPFWITHHETCITLINELVMIYLFSPFSHVLFIQLSCFMKSESFGTTSAIACIYTFLYFLNAVIFPLYYLQKKSPFNKILSYHLLNNLFSGSEVLQFYENLCSVKIKMNYSRWCHGSGKWKESPSFFLYVSVLRIIANAELRFPSLVPIQNVVKSKS